MFFFLNQENTVVAFELKVFAESKCFQAFVESNEKTNTHVSGEIEDWIFVEPHVCKLSVIKTSIARSTGCVCPSEGYTSVTHPP